MDIILLHIPPSYLFYSYLIFCLEITNSGAQTGRFGSVQPNSIMSPLTCFFDIKTTADGADHRNLSFECMAMLVGIEQFDI